ncbi:cellulase family glycosylhydrolase [Halorussus limi]|uniref:Cellulase family glycosylhydrolase n=1 Tax=Halorussus limi TaxID=2938695 RepID=A0A8U0HSD0_9EURY|nr:cellulase family glycosylhydrolase [Halorussus limi]UPV73721.1 cellulase family glycosylhydrolase [Halorussus limi]
MDDAGSETRTSNADRPGAGSRSDDISHSDATSRNDTTSQNGSASRNDSTSGNDDALRDVRGAVYLPQKDWNAYQMWADYENATIERELGYAARLRLNSVRVFASYEYWREDGPAFFAHVEHFLSACRERGIRPIVVLFEAPPELPPTEENCRERDPQKAFGVHSPSRPEILRPRNWKGYDRSPIHFARRWAQEYAEDDRLLATEIMNEPGDVRPRRDFVTDALGVVRRTAPEATLTMGTKDVRFARVYDRDDALDAYQFHMNLPRDRDAAREYVAEQRALADDIAAEVGDGESSSPKPLWCTEWQRTLEEPPTRFAPNLASLAPTIREVHDAGTLDGDFFWSLMLRPAYLRTPREKGRVNGLFHEDGAVYSRLDAETIAGQSLELARRDSLPSSWRTHRFPYPDSDGARRPDPGSRPEIARVDEPVSESKSAGVGSHQTLRELRELRDALTRRIREMFDPGVGDQSNDERSNDERSNDGSSNGGMSNGETSNGGMSNGETSNGGMSNGETSNDGK